MKIDFRMMTKHQARGGLIMELAPGTKGNNIDGSQSVFFSEDAFNFVEKCISKAWPAYQKWGHWCVTEIPSSAWLEVINFLTNLSKQIEQARSPLEIHGIWFRFKRVKFEFYMNFGKLRFELLSMIASLIKWLSQQLKFAEVITIFGI